jgi:hypothetical protein
LPGAINAEVRCHGHGVRAVQKHELPVLFVSPERKS